MMDETLRKLEALLFLAGEAVSYKELGQLIDQPAPSAKAAVEKLRTALRDHGLTIVTTDSHAQLTTSRHVTAYLQRFLQGEAQQLSAAAAETLAIIAYRGPMNRIAIEAIRGVDCRRMIRQLVARGLVRRKKLPEQLPVYSITEDFLQHLGLTRREDLPKFEELAQHAKIKDLLKPTSQPGSL